MTIRNEEELRMFEDKIKRCKRAVLLVTPEGEQFDLTTFVGRIQGINAMLRMRDDCQEPELFISCFEDEMIIFEFFEYLDHCRKAA